MHSWIIIDKPLGKSSTQVGNCIKRQGNMALVFSALFFCNQVSYAKDKCPKTFGRVYEKLENRLANSPIGDSDTDIFTFITESLLKEKTYSQDEITQMINEERDALKNGNKPRIANTYERELGRILSIFCGFYHGCKRIELYQKNGVCIASASINDDKDVIDDELMQLGFLGNDPYSRIGVHQKSVHNYKIIYEESKIYYNDKYHQESRSVKIIKDKNKAPVNKKIYEVIKAIHYDEERQQAKLSCETSPPADKKTIGFVRFIIE